MTGLAQLSFSHKLSLAKPLTPFITSDCCPVLPRKTTLHLKPQPPPDGSLTPTGAPWESACWDMPKTTQYPQLHHEILHAEMYQRPRNTPGCTTRLCRLSCTSPSICKKESTRIAKWAQMIRKMLGKKSANDHLTFWVYKAVMEENIHRLQCV